MVKLHPLIVLYIAGDSAASVGMNSLNSVTNF